ncbi:HNH endonuclease signature motif containing protein [Corynebacterium kutscheri]|nr:HNH endonuclease signature motif containing protein [Corynebacterium kutscheri]
MTSMLDALQQLAHGATALMAELVETHETHDQLAEKLRMEMREIKLWRRIAKRYLDDPELLASAKGLSMADVVMAHKQSAQLNAHVDKSDKRTVELELLTQAHARTHEEFCIEAKDRVRALNATCPDQPRSRVEISTKPTAHNMMYLSAFLNRDTFGPALRRLEELTDTLMREDYARGHARAEALEKMLSGEIDTHTQNTSTIIATPRVNRGLGVHAVIRADELPGIGIINRTNITLTDGNVLSGAIRELLDGTGWFTVYNSTGTRPIWTERIRYFNDDQRAMLIAHQIYCAHPDCTKLAHYADGHHITAYAKGGPTTLDNAVMLCRQHHRDVEHGHAEILIRKDGEYEYHDIDLDTRRTNIMPGRAYAAGALIRNSPPQRE